MKDTFGGREIIRDKCVPEDFISIGKSVPKRIDKYVLTKCLNCGKIIPTEKRNLKLKNCRCEFCILQNDFIKVDDIVSKIVVTSHYGTFEYIVDTDMLNTLSQYRWRIVKKRNKKYLATGTFRKGTAIYLHQMVYNDTVPRGYTIDHEDSNEFNNMRGNLKCVTISENAQNVNAKCTNKLGIRGVYYDKKTGKYACSITMNGTIYYFKAFKTLDEAVLNRYEAEQYFGLKMGARNPKVQEIIKNASEEAIQEAKEYVSMIIKRRDTYAENNQES